MRIFSSILPKFGVNFSSLALNVTWKIKTKRKRKTKRKQKQKEKIKQQPKWNKTQLHASMKQNLRLLKANSCFPVTCFVFLFLFLFFFLFVFVFVFFYSTKQVTISFFIELYNIFKLPLLANKLQHKNKCFKQYNHYLYFGSIHSIAH